MPSGFDPAYRPVYSQAGHTGLVDRTSGLYRPFRDRERPLACARGYNPVRQDGDFAISAPVTISVLQATSRTRLRRERWVRITREASCPAIALIMTTREKNAQRDDRSRPAKERTERMSAALEPVRLEEAFDFPAGGVRNRRG